MHCVDVAYKPLYRLENLDFARNCVIDRGLNKVFFQSNIQIIIIYLNSMSPITGGLVAKW